MMQWLRKHMEFVEYVEYFWGTETMNPMTTIEDGCLSNGSGIWLSAENSEVYSGIPMYDYYAEGELYELGVYTKWEEKINSMGWYSEWYDPGTVMLWKI